MINSLSFEQMLISWLVIAAMAVSNVAAQHEQKSTDKQNGMKSNSKVVYPAKNPDSYKAPSGWKLVWADEFDGKDVNLKNWTRQILPEPFNDEWQQYFDRKENAFVEDGYLVLKAIHHSKQHGKGSVYVGAIAHGRQAGIQVRKDCSSDSIALRQGNLAGVLDAWKGHRRNRGQDSMAQVW